MASLMLLSLPIAAEPWLEVGDRGLRSDVELLATQGLIDGPISTWPLPAGQLAKLSNEATLTQQPTYVRAAARRVLQRLLGEGQPAGLHTELLLRGADKANLVRDFGATARNEFDSRIGLIWDDRQTSVGLRVGDQSRFNQDDTHLAFDGSYVSMLFDNVQMYGGYIDKWYGPGEVSSLVLSNNARPFPKIGLMRNVPHAFETPWLSWLGPWQVDTFVGLLDGPRQIGDTLVGSLRITLTPFRNFDIGFTRLTEFCGSNQKCNPLSAAFHVNNSDASTNSVNDQAAFDVQYRGRLGRLQISPYLQLMNEDTGPFTHSYTSYLAGSSLAGPLGQGGARWQLTVEYSDTVPALNLFDLGKKAYLAAYNNSQYIDGMRYRDRALGFSLDSDSRLFSIVDTFTDGQGRSYRLAYHRADINHAIPNPLPPGSLIYNSSSYNALSAQPALIHQFEGGISIPLRDLQFDLSLRHQSGQLAPETGARTGGELDISYRF